MKKVISILIALTLVFAFVGCEPAEDDGTGGGGGTTPNICQICGGDKAKKPSECICNAYNKDEKLSTSAVNLLKEIGLEESDVLAPKGAKFGDFVGNSSTNYFACYWTGANKVMFDNYEKEYLALKDRAAVGDKTPWVLANISFSDKAIAADDDDNAIGKEIPAGSIIFASGMNLRTK